MNDENKESELFVCPECKEWTETDEPCCGLGPKDVEWEANEER